MDAVDEFARMLHGFSRRIDQAANQPRLIASAYPADTSIDVVDPETGEPVMSIGRQHDDTVAAVPINGPVPPVPSAPVVEVGRGVLVVAYDGRMASEADRFPMDGEHIEVWVKRLADTPDPDDDVEDEEGPETEPVPDPGADPDDPTPPEPVPDPETLPDVDMTGARVMATLPASGGSVAIGTTPGTYMVTLRTLTQAGRRSGHSAAAVGVVLGFADLKIDEKARRLSEEAAEKARQAVEDLQDAREWIDQTGEELVTRVGGAESLIDAVEGVLAGVRARVGSQRWVPNQHGEPQVLVVHDPSPTTTEFVRAEPLGDGRVRFTALLPGTHTDWQVGTAVGLADGTTYTHTFTETGTPWVRVRTDGVLHQAPFTVTAPMLGPVEDLGAWEDAELGLDQLRDGALDPEVFARLFQDVVVAGIVAATEAFIGSDAILENSVQARHVVASESLWAKLATFARVTTDMLLVGGMNLLPDPRFEDPELTAGRMSRSAATTVSGGFQTTNYFYFCPGTTAADVRRYAVPVTAGDTYRIEVPVTLTSALSSTPRVETWNASAMGRTLRTVTDWTYQDGVLSYTYTVPEGVAYLSPVIYRTTSYTVHPGARVTLMADSRLLVDGAVTARALNVVHELPSGAVLRMDPDGVRVWRAGNTGPNPNIALTAGDGLRVQKDTGEGLLWIDPATGDLHTNGAVLSNSELAAPTITGGTFRTGVTGRRQQIDTANGFRAWNAAGQQTAQIDGQDNWLAGTFRTNRPGQPGMIAGTSTEGYPIMLWSESGEGYWSDAYITAGFTWDDAPQWDLLFSARTGSYLRFRGGLTGMPEGQFYSEGPWTISSNGSGKFRSLSTTGATAAQGTVNAESIGLDANMDNRLIFEGSGVLRAPGIRANSNTNAANVFINASGRLHFGTSARRFKNDIQDIPEDWPERILDLNPKTWIDAGEAAEHKEGDPPLRRVPGLVAEDVEDAGLSAYVTYADGQVQGLSYDRLWTLLIPVVRKQRDRITDLEQKVTALEQQVADLTARLDRLDPEGA